MRVEVSMTHHRSLAFFTIVAKNYFAYARTLSDSIKKHHPEAKIFIALSDPTDTKELQYYKNVEYITSDQLNLPSPGRFAFRYDVLEFSTAIKPYIFKWIMNHHRAEDVIYLDPDVFILSPLKQVCDLLKNGATAVLTPHLTAPLMDGKKPDEIGILQTGVYNLGFIALRRGEESQKFLDWWSDRLEKRAVVDFAAGLFTDQKWVDLAPCLFNNIALLKSPGYNLAYWNLNHREVTYEGGHWLANGELISFVHFSGINPDKPSELSKHQTRYAVTDLGPFKVLFMHYIQLLMDNAYKKTIKIPYGFGQLADGTRIHKSMRVYFREFLDLNEAMYSDPFQTLTADFFNTLEPRLPGNHQVTRFMYGYYLLRKDLYSTFNLNSPAGQHHYTSWFTGCTALKEVDPVFIVQAMKNLRSKRPLALLILQGMVRKIPHTLLTLYRKILAYCRAELKRSKAALKKSLLTMDYYLNPQSIEPKPLEQQKITLIGYATGDFGLGQTFRANAKALLSVQQALSIISISSEGIHSEGDHSLSPLFVNQCKSPIQLYTIAPNQMQHVYTKYQQQLNNPSAYKIAYWYWELSQFPHEWMHLFDLVDEVWAPSRFIFDALSSVSPKPVYYMPTSIEVNRHEEYRPADFDLQENKFLFLASYDFHSYVDRKNPQAVVEAFQIAFPYPEGGMQLVIKTTNALMHPQKYIQLLELAQNDPRIRIFNNALTREQILGLFQACDCYVSLHRAEGFCLGLAECMWLAKPVIATAYSGNLDFMNSENSCLVDYSLIPVPPESYVGSAGQQWANPDTQHAAAYMRRIYEDKEYRSKIARKGQEFIQKQHGFNRIGLMMRARIDEIKANRLKPA